MTKKLLTLKVNGVEHVVAAEPQAVLLDVLRETLRLTGSKRGCDMGTCGCCAVQIDGVARLSCLTLAHAAQGSEITTIEGLTPAEGLHPLQRAFAECGGSQCGFCTPGFVVACHAFLRQAPDPTDAEIREAISGNMCRCTGYVKIIEAVKRAADEMRGEPLPPEEVRRERSVVER